MSALPDAVTAQALAWADRLRAFVIQTGAQYVEAVTYTKRIKGEIATIADILDPHIQRAHEAHKALLAEKARAQAPLFDAERVLKAALQAYDAEQERVRQAEEQRLLAVARADEEARRLAAAAALEADAVATGDASLLAEAERVLATPLPVSVSVEKGTPQGVGVSYRDHWTAKVTSLVGLIRWVAQHPDHVNLLKPNQTALDGLARSMHDKLKVDGVQAVNTPTVAVGR